MEALSAAQSRRGWYHGWNIVAVAIFAQIAAGGMAVNAFTLFLRPWSRDLHSPVSTLQFCMSALSLGTAFLSPWAGALIDRFPARRLFAVGVIGMGAFHFCIGSVTQTWQLIALFALLLPASSALMTTMAGNALLSRWFVRRLGLALGLASLGIGLGGVVVPPVIAAVMPAFGWRPIWRGAGLIILFVLLPIILWAMRDRPTDRDGLHYVADGEESARASMAEGDPISGDPSLGWRDVFGRRNFWLLVMTFVSIVSVFAGCAQNLGPIAASRGLDTQAAGVLLALFSVSQLAASLGMGLASDRFGNRLPLATVAMATGLGGLTMAFAHGPVEMGIAMILIGFNGGMWPLLSAALAVEFGSRAFGRAVGLLMMFAPIAGLSPFLTAKMHEISGSYVPVLVGLAVLSMAAGCACLLLRERKRPFQISS